MKLKTRITGSKVHGVGYRAFLLMGALELGIQRFAAYNKTENGKEIVIVLTDGVRYIADKG